MNAATISTLVLSLSASEAQRWAPTETIDTETMLSSTGAPTEDDLGLSLTTPPQTTDKSPTSPTESKPHSPQPTPDRECQPGVPVSVSWPEMDFAEAPIEFVGDTPDGSAMAAPNGRDEKGRYNTVGFYGHSAEPGTESGTPVLAIHATQSEPSLIYPRDQRVAELRELRDSGSSTTITIEQDNGSTCEYKIDKESGMELEVDKLDRAIGYSAIMNSWYSLEEGIENENLIVLFCIGEYSVKTGSSDNIVMLRGKPVN